MRVSKEGGMHGMHRFVWSARWSCCEPKDTCTMCRTCTSCNFLSTLITAPHPSCPLRIMSAQVGRVARLQCRLCSDELLRMEQRRLLLHTVIFIYSIRFLCFVILPPDPPPPHAFI